jgi:hypothetical protein
LWWRSLPSIFSSVLRAVVSMYTTRCSVRIETEGAPIDASGMISKTDEAIRDWEVVRIRAEHAVVTAAAR